MPSLQDARKNGFEQVVMACDMPEPCKFPPLDSCQKRFLWAHKKVDLAQHPGGVKDRITCLLLINLLIYLGEG